MVRKLMYLSNPCSTGRRRYGTKLWKTFTDCFNCLPIAAIIDEKIFCCHGGLSPDLQSMEQIRRIMRPTDVPDTGIIVLMLFFILHVCRLFLSCWWDSCIGWQTTSWNRIFDIKKPVILTFLISISLCDRYKIVYVEGHFLWFTKAWCHDLSVQGLVWCLPLKNKLKADFPSKAFIYIWFFWIAPTVSPL